MSITTASLPAGFSCVSAANGVIPPSAVAAGKEKSGESLYIARVRDGDAIHVGKCGAHIRGAITSYEGREQFHCNYEVLCGSPSQLKWVEQSGKFDLSKIVGTPIVGGIDGLGATLFITRSKAGSVNGSLRTASIPIGVQPGRISSLMSGASNCFEGREYFSKHYEVLVYQYAGFSWVQTSGGYIPPGAIAGGKENDRRGALYIARGWFIGSGFSGGSLQIGKAASHLGGGSFAFDNRENFISDVEIFTGPSSGVSWVSARGQFNPDSISGNPVIGGVDVDGAILYIARVRYSGGIQPGKASRNLPDGAHFGADNAEKTSLNYEILVYN